MGVGEWEGLKGGFTKGQEEAFGDDGVFISLMVVMSQN